MLPAILSKQSRKSGVSAQFERRSSPSVMMSTPASCCSLTASSTAASSTGLSTTGASPGSRDAAARRASGERSRLPTVSARVWASREFMSNLRAAVRGHQALVPRRPGGLVALPLLMSGDDLAAAGRELWVTLGPAAVDRRKIHDLARVARRARQVVDPAQAAEEISDFYDREVLARRCSARVLCLSQAMSRAIERVPPACARPAAAATTSATMITRSWVRRSHAIRAAALTAITARIAFRCPLASGDLRAEPAGSDEVTVFQAGRRNTAL